jgi:periplasmic divalent cation tolerance protein
MDEFIIVLVTTASMEEAEGIARRLVEEGVAPCANIVPSCLSIYQWKGDVHRDEECLMIVKSKRELFPKVKEIVEEYHSYQVPEIISIDLAEVSDKYKAYLEGYFK